MADLTDEQCDAFRRLPGSFNDMVRAIYRAGMNAATPPADAALADDALCESLIEASDMRWNGDVYIGDGADLMNLVRAALRARAVPDGFVVIPAAWFDREIPRIDAGGANPITPDEHCCEWVLYQERERIHLALSAALAASKAGDGGAG